MQRPCEQQHWVRLAYIGPTGRAYRPSDNLLAPLEVNAATETLLVIDRMIRKGQRAWRLSGMR